MMTKIEKKIFNKNGEWNYKSFEEGITVEDMYLLGDPNGAQTAIIECIRVPYKKDKSLYYEKKYKLLFSDFEDRNVENITNQNTYAIPAFGTRRGDVFRNYTFRVVLSSIADLPVGCNLMLRFYNHYLMVLVKYKKKLNELSSRVWFYTYSRFSFDHDSGIKNKLIPVDDGYNGYRQRWAMMAGRKYTPNPESLFVASEFVKEYLKKL